MSKRVVLLGHPVTHSLSEALQKAAFASLGIDATYEPLDTPIKDLPDAIEALRSEEFLGANISVPHKDRVVALVDRLTEEAQHTGAVDTITCEGDRLVGHNTDVLGFKPALGDLVGNQKMPRSAVVLGAGGGARAVVYTLIREGFQHIVVFNRHLHRGERMVKHFARSAAHMELRAKPWHESVIEAELAKTDILVNASSVGRDPDESPIPPELLPPDILVLDLHYVPKETQLLRDAAAAGATRVMNGDLMLLDQSAAAFELWTGQKAPLDTMREQLEASRNEPEAPVETAAADELIGGGEDAGHAPSSGAAETADAEPESADAEPESADAEPVERDPQPEAAAAPEEGDATPEEADSESEPGAGETEGVAAEAGSPGAVAEADQEE